MARAFQYKPRIVDIRVRPPSEEDASKHDVNALKPGERRCDHPDCGKAGSARAPKGRDMLHEHYWFCQAHAAEYNRNWNFFSGLSDAEVRRRQTEESMTGGRPTWDMKASRTSREAAAFAAKFGKGQSYKDPFGMFHGAGQQSAEPAGRKLGKIERNALADLDLDEMADGPKIRARYTELVRRLHPDANNGDRSGENRLQRVIRAYQTLRKMGLVQGT